MSLFPANGATNVCTDTSLRITFDAPPGFTNFGVVTVYTAANVPVDTNDMSLCVNKTGSPNVQARYLAGGSSSAFSFFTFPIITTGNTATIFPHQNVLTTNQTYYVNITAGLFTNSTSGGFAGISNSTTWSFTTKSALPPAGTNGLQVAADNTGDFCTVQGALDFLPAANNNPVLINIRKGVYREIVWVNAKNKITFRGEDRKQTIITYASNENLNPGSTKRFLMHVNGDDCVIENLTLTNSTPKGGSQAEALRTNSRRFICNNSDLASYQDTLLLNSFGRYGYYYNCLIQGDVDFIWNDGVAVFQSCEIKSLSSGGYICQMRSDPTRYGAVFLDCVLTKSPGVSGCYFNRIDPGSSPASAAAFINCRMDTHIIPAGWLVFGSTSLTNGLRLWEYQSTNLAGTAAIDVSGRAAYSSQLSAAQANALRNLTNVYNPNQLWLPQLPPNIITQPTNQTAAYSSNVTFIVSATGIETANTLSAGNPSIIVPLHYQWLKNGTNYPGATNASLTISNAQAADAGTYSLVVSNLSGSTTSSNALLLVEVPNRPDIQSAVFTNGQFRLTFTGDSGLNYGVQRSTNLINWQTVFATNDPLLPFVWTDGDAIAPKRFYRILVNP